MFLLLAACASVPASEDWVALHVQPLETENGLFVASLPVRTSMGLTAAAVRLEVCTGSEDQVFSVDEFRPSPSSPLAIELLAVAALAKNDSDVPPLDQADLTMALSEDIDSFEDPIDRAVLGFYAQLAYQLLGWDSDELDGVVVDGASADVASAGTIARYVLGAPRLSVDEFAADVGISSIAIFDLVQLIDLARLQDEKSPRLDRELEAIVGEFGPPQELELLAPICEQLPELFRGDGRAAPGIRDLLERGNVSGRSEYLVPVEAIGTARATWAASRLIGETSARPDDRVSLEADPQNPRPTAADQVFICAANENFGHGADGEASAAALEQQIEGLLSTIELSQETVVQMTVLLQAAQDCGLPASALARTIQRGPEPEEKLPLVLYLRIADPMRLEELDHVGFEPLSPIHVLAQRIIDPNLNVAEFTDGAPIAQCATGAPMLRSNDDPQVECDVISTVVASIDTRLEGESL